MKATDPGRLSPSLRHHEFGDGAELAEALATKVGAVLQAAIQARGRALIAVSGGSTPKRFFEALSEQEIDWDRVTVTLIDERLVPPENERSNHGLASRHLLKNHAAAAHFIPLYAKAEDAVAAARIAATRIEGLGGPLDVAVLGMGTDGHTASFFPGGSRLAEATDIDCPLSVIAMEAPGAGEPRLTLTLPKIVEAGLIVLHIEGTEKKAVLARALQPGPDADMPVRSVLRDAAEPVEIYWAP